MANIRDVAAAAQVSAATVSRVINGGPVKSATREKVLKTIDAMNFKPNAYARGLGLGRAGMFGVIVPAMTYGYYAQVVEGISRALMKTHYELALRVSYHETGSEEVLAKLLGEKRVDALIIITPREFGYPASPQGFPSDIPVVFLDGSPTEKIPAISGNNFDGGYQVGKHLLELGHERFGVILGQRHCTESSERLAGFKFALEQAHFTFDESNLHYSDYMIEGGRHAAQKLLSKTHRPTAIFCANDMMAYGTLEAAESLGLKVPDDLSIVGYDDTPMAEWVRPSLTTVYQPKTEMGEAGVGYLLRWIQDKEPAEQQHLLLPVHLIRRSSTGHPPE